MTVGNDRNMHHNGCSILGKRHNRIWHSLRSTFNILR